MSNEFKPQLEDQRYDNYVVAFIDILGFSNIIEKSSSDREYFEKILHATQLIEHFVGHNHDKKESEGRTTEMTQFSDSLVISRPFIDINDFWDLIMELDLVQKAIASEVGIVIRGGVTSGLLYHKGSISFGPAFVEAYLLESKEAKYPRIIIDPKILNKSGELQHDVLIELFKNNNLRKDFDGFYFIDFLGGNFAGSSAPEVASKLKEYANRELANITEETDLTKSIRSKMEWILNYVKECNY